MTTPTAPAPSAPTTAAPVPAPATPEPAAAAPETPAPRQKGPDQSKVRELLARKGHTPPEAEKPAEDAPTAEGEPKKEPEPEPSSALAKRLASIAAAEERAKRKAAEVDAKEKGLGEKLGQVQAIETARAQGPLALAKALVGESDEKLGELFYALTEHFHGEGRKAETEEERVDRLVKKRLEDERKNESTAREQRGEEVRNQYVATVAEAFKESPTKWPAIAHFGASPGDIHDVVRGFWKEHRRAPTQTETLDRVEQRLNAKIEASRHSRPESKPTAEPAAGTTPKTVTSSWANDHGAAPSEPSSLRESRDLIKRKYLKT